MHLRLHIPEGGRRHHMIPPKAPPIQIETPRVNVDPEGFGGGMVNISLLPLYPDHIGGHVWGEEVKFNCIHYLKHICNNSRSL